jgi:predicted phosphoribosyltransferase
MWWLLIKYIAVFANQRTKPLYLTFQDGLCKIHEFFDGLYLSLLLLFNGYCIKINMKSNIIDLPELREQTHVFRDRAHAGQVLARMLTADDRQAGIILAIPAGGVPVGAMMAEKTGLDFDVAVVSKITLPWNTEAGYGAVAFDGTVKLNEDLVRRVNLTVEEVKKGIEKTTAKVERRVKKLRGGQSFPDLVNRCTILVDDGLASGFTMRVAVTALRNTGAGPIVVAVPTGHRRSAEMIAQEVETLYCANIRGGFSYAVAGAYKHWSDVAEEDVVKILQQLR